MQRDSLDRHAPADLLPVVLSASGSILTPVFGHVGTMTNYVHEFTHNGRHLLTVPRH